MGLFRRRELEPQAAYAKWARSYPPRPHNALMEAEQSAMEAFLRPLSVSRALDVGTGTGRYLDVLAKAHVASRVGLDLSEAMLSRARPLGAPLIRSDARSLPFSNESFDLVLASLMLGDIRDLSSWTREMSRVLRPGGSLLYSDFHPSWSERGWKRTFDGEDGISWAVPYHPHRFEDHERAAQLSSLGIVCTAEPSLDRDPVCLIVLAEKL